MIGASLPLVIAEAGVNHNGDRGRALEMVTAAAEAGADLVKFQAFRAEELVTADAATADYQQRNSGAATQAELLRSLELEPEDLAAIAADCRARHIGFLCTAFSPQMTAELVALGMEYIKVASGELTNHPALRHFASFGLPVLLSTGMAEMGEVEAAVAVLREAGAARIVLLHCTSLYPAPYETLNLRAMVTMAERTGLPVGYSDHSLGDHAAVAAVALGAQVIEKHFTLDRRLPGPDHVASLEPDELGRMVRRLRETAAALGDGRKRPAPGERETAALVRRSWHARRDLPAGTVLRDADLVLMRPAHGLSPAQDPAGRVLRRNCAAGQAITAADLA